MMWENESIIQIQRAKIGQVLILICELKGYKLFKGSYIVKHDQKTTLRLDGEKFVHLKILALASCFNFDESLKIKTPTKIQISS